MKFETLLLRTLIDIKKGEMHIEEAFDAIQNALQEELDQFEKQIRQEYEE